MKSDTLIIALFVIIIIGFLFFVTLNFRETEKKGSVGSESKTMISIKPQSRPPMEINRKKSYEAVMKTTYGDMVIALYPSSAPETVNNFVHLAKNGFYENTVFHRVIKGFMIQGGDPKGDGTGGPGYTIPAEIGLKHVRGSIAMARLSDQVNPKKDSSGSQFYIAHQDIPQLDGEYTVFGKVIKGIEVVDKIASSPVTASNMGEESKPVDPVKVQSIKIVEK